MVITNHAIERFRERVTLDSEEVVRQFIEEDIKQSECLYSINGVEEKRICNGIIYVIDKSNPMQEIVVTLYLKWENNQKNKTISKGSRH